MAGILFFEDVQRPSYFTSSKKDIVKAKLVLTLLLVQEENGLWTEPGGKKEPSEEDKHTATRETREEFCNFIRIDPKSLSSKAQVTLKTGYKVFLVFGACPPLGFSLKYYKKNREKILQELKITETKLKSYNSKRKSASNKTRLKKLRILEDKKQTISSWNETKNISRVAVDKILLAVLSQANQANLEEKETNSGVLVRDLENNLLLLHSRTVAALQECLRKQLFELLLKASSRSLVAHVFASPNIPKILFRVSKFKIVAAKENKLEFLNGTTSYIQIM